MRVLLGAVSLLVALVVVGMLAKKQLTALEPVRVTAPAAAAGAGSPQQVNTHQLQTQVKDAMESALQQRRPEPDDK